MLQYSVTKYGEPVQHFDLHALPIAGTYAHKLTGVDLYHELQKLNVPGIAPTDGWMDLAVKFAKFRADPSAAPAGGVTTSKHLGVTG
jgi:hypothetical protein